MDPAAASDGSACARNRSAPITASAATTTTARPPTEPCSRFEIGLHTDARLVRLRASATVRSAARPKREIPDAGRQRGDRDEARGLAPVAAERPNGDTEDAETRRRLHEHPEPDRDARRRESAPAHQHRTDQDGEADEPVVVPAVDDREDDGGVQPDERDRAHASTLDPQDREHRDDTEERDSLKREPRPQHGTTGRLRQPRPTPQ